MLHGILIPEPLWKMLLVNEATLEVEIDLRGQGLVGTRVASHWRQNGRDLRC